MRPCGSHTTLIWRGGMSASECSTNQVWLQPHRLPAGPDRGRSNPDPSQFLAHETEAWCTCDVPRTP
jgi:hypothetical protein